MTFKYNRGILLIFIIIICFNLFTKAQTAIQDSSDSNYVNIAYGKQPARLVSSAISTIKGDELLKSFTPNLANTLYGRLSGLTVAQGGNEPGADAPTLYIRGINTYGSGRSILVIVDGVESSYDRLVPDEIESISVLKDASATALYGTRGANGVLLVTTKRGIKGPMEVTFSTQQGFSTPQRLPEFLESYDFATLYNEALNNNGQTARYSATDIEAYRTGSDPVFYPDVNWYDEILKKSAYVSNYDLNFRGGNNGVKYFVLINALNQDGLYKKTEDISDNSIDQKYSRINFRSNVDINLTKRLAATMILGGSIENKSNPAGQTSSGLFDLMATIPPNAFMVYNPNNTFGGSSLFSNPLGDVLSTGFYTSNSRTIQATLKFTEQLDFITKGLTASALVSFNNFFSGNSNKTRTYARYSLTKDVLGNIVYNKIGTETSLTASEGMLSQWRNSTIQAFLNYDRTFSNNRIEGMLMYNNERVTVAGIGIPYKYIGMGGRFTFTNNKKYVGEFSFAYNANGDFPEGNRMGFFPAGSLGWIVSNENFLKDNSTFNFLKIRGSYGLVGNDVIGGARFMFNPQPYVYTPSYFYGTSNTTVSSIAEGMTANPDITWEKEKKMNIGLEATLFKQLDFAFDFFKNDRSDILSKPSRTVPQYLGFGTLQDYNLGKTTNSGFELMVRLNGDKTANLKYFVEANVWYAKNKIVFNAEPIQQDTYLYRTGQVIDQPFLLESLGFFKDQADVDASPTQIFSPAHPGDIKYKDQNGDRIVNSNDMVPIGNTTIPRLTVGFETGFEFKGFDLNFFIQAVTARSVYLSGKYYEAFQNNGKISTVALGRWTTETATAATYPRLSAVNDLTNFQSSSFWQRDGSFIKLRSVEFGYTFMDGIVKKGHLNSARIFINGTNLFSLDHMDFTDPESLTGYPAFRTYSIGARIQF